MTFRKISKVAIPIALATIPFLVLAALPQPTNPLPGSTGLTLAEAEDLINRIARFMIVVSVVVAVIFIIWGAVVWITAGGSEDRLKKGRGIVWNGVLGALIIFLIGVILQTISNLVARTFFG